MASFTHTFSTLTPPGGWGSTHIHKWNSVYPPEMGCVVSPPLPVPLPSFGGGSGSVFGPPVTSYVPSLASTPSLGAGPLSVVARVTDRARQLLARSVVDGTSLRITTAAIGTGGFDVSNPTSTTPIDTSATSLQNEIYRAAIDDVEVPLTTGTAASFVTRIGRGTILSPIGEVGLYATISNSPVPFENGTSFLFCIGHQPIQTGTNNHVFSLRVIVGI